MPCSNCLRSRNAVCIFETHSSPAMPALSTALQDPRGTTAASHTSAASTTLACSDNLTSPVSHSPDAHVEALQSRIKQLEEQLSKATPGTFSSQARLTTPNIETTTSRLGGTFHFDLEGRTADTSKGVSRSVVHKKRVFGQSHWLNVIPLVRFKD
jgi:hypothetical protein